MGIMSGLGTVYIKQLKNSGNNTDAVLRRSGQPEFGTCQPSVS